MSTALAIGGGFVLMLVLGGIYIRLLNRWWDRRG